MGEVFVILLGFALSGFHLGWWNTDESDMKHRAANYIDENYKPDIDLFFCFQLVRNRSSVTMSSKGIVYNEPISGI
ncbi:hypothetical protein EAE99_002143 [Botrytis elliptica]|nr:hypothetical protein EAE99_002143 [Botrytis elliptica]